MFKLHEIGNKSITKALVRTTTKYVEQALAY